ncbi:MAG: type I restriction enzyme HsdR N-terminal domain-containing protein [Alistipes sp.]|nr:type I restriction enzyme HsdR N-terminal domain-containing protein [Alistipes sp.]
MKKSEQYKSLNFPYAELRLQNGDDGKCKVYDIVRGKYIAFTPEEHVRQHTIHFLVSHCSVPLRSIIAEYPVILNGTAQRADIVVVAPSGAPLMLVECKAPDVVIDRYTFSQAVRYNMILKARYIILTNGLKHYCYECTADGGCTPISSFPRFESQ